MLLLSGPLQIILDSIQQMQIIVHILLIGVVYPATVIVFFGMLMKLLTFQVVNFSDVYNTILRLDPDSEGNQPYNELFNRMGYGSLYIVQNFGSLFGSLFITPLIWFASIVLVRLFRGRFTDFKKKWEGQMFFDFWVKFFYETYLFLSVCTCLNM